MASSQQATWSWRFLESGTRNQSWLQKCLFTTVTSKHTEDRRSWKTTGWERSGEERRGKERRGKERRGECKSLVMRLFQWGKTLFYNHTSTDGSCLWNRWSDWHTDRLTAWLADWTNRMNQLLAEWRNKMTEPLDMWADSTDTLAHTRAHRHTHTQLSAPCVCLDYEIIPHQSSFCPKICLHSNAKYRQTAKALSFISAIVWATALSSTGTARQGLTFPVWLWMLCYVRLIKVIFQSKNQNYTVKFWGNYNDDDSFLLAFLRWPSLLTLKNKDGKIRLSSIKKKVSMLHMKNKCFVECTANIIETFPLLFPIWKWGTDVFLLPILRVIKLSQLSLHNWSNKYQHSPRCVQTLVLQGIKYSPRTAFP